MTSDSRGSTDPDDTSVEHDSTLAYEPPLQPGEAGAGAQVSGSFRYALVVERGPRAGLTYVLGTGATVAGRADDVEIFLGDVTVSRHHARFDVDDGGLTVADLGSTNGTYVNMQRRDSAPLEPGDEVIIGKFHLIVVQGNG
jgi:pSer/pThr/pTyr-binding forkhead associated (FHA) protein